VKVPPDLFFNLPKNFRYTFNLTNTGRIFFGTTIAVLGALTLFDRDFPYFLIPADHSWISRVIWVAYAASLFLILTGALIVANKKLTMVSFRLGNVLAAVFLFYQLPYQLFVSDGNSHFGDWENSAKELALAAGAWVVAGSPTNRVTGNVRTDRVMPRLASIGRIVFALMIISFSVDHFLYAEQAADYVPAWIPYHLFWMYFAGLALLAAGIAITINVKTRLAATLLGAMTLTWFLILHVPRIAVAPISDLSGEIASAMLALGYSGIAWVIAGTVNSIDPQ
jgi:uncharacterized membrane protein YphA (DoxX/SURF4 family)